MKMKEKICRRLAAAFRPVLYLCGFAMFASSCGGDDDPAPLKPQLPATVGSPVKSITHYGAQASTFDWNFNYSDQRLTQATGTRRDANPADDRKFTYTSKLSYGYNSLTVKNNSDEDVKVTLNTQNYIEKMTVNSNEYKFYYSDGRIIRWEKTIYETTFGQAKKYESSANITYDNGNFASITYIDADKVPVTLTFVPDNKVNFNGILPVGISDELGLWGIEHLYYAGLLGRPTANLVKSITATCQEDATRNFTLNYEYNQTGNNVTICNYHTPDGGVASVNYGY